MIETYRVQLLETSLILVLYIIAFFITKTVINNTLKKTQLQRTRRKIIIKAINLITTIIAVIFIAGVWGLNQSEIALFASTIFTALGIAFFAQWSLLSNITSSIILFFNHPLKLGDTIKVLDKDYPFEGEVTDLTYFFVHLRTTSGEIITIPNSLILQKSIAVIEKTESK
jgi:small-conductance mechanosensitive channel